MALGILADPNYCFQEMTPVEESGQQFCSVMSTWHCLALRTENSPIDFFCVVNI